MKWTLFIQQKMKVAMLLFCIMFFVILTNILGSRNLDSINQSVNSIYNDRLIPATDVYYISDNLHSKKALLESLLLTEGKNKRISAEIEKRDKSINKLITHFETTYLVNGETRFMHDFKMNYTAYNNAEATVSRLINAGELQAAHNVFNHDIKSAHEKNIQILGKLMNIQSSVGKDLITQSQFNANVFNTLSALQIVIAMVIGALIVKLVMASRLANAPYEKYTMN